MALSFGRVSDRVGGVCSVTIMPYGALPGEDQGLAICFSVLGGSGTAPCSSHSCLSGLHLLSQETCGAFSWSLTEEENLSSPIPAV